MSIEAKIDALIAALNANTAALQAHQAIAHAKATQTPAPAGKTDTTGANAGKTTVGAAGGTATNKASGTQPQQQPQSTALNYMKDVQPAALKLVNAEGGRPKMVEILTKYSVKLGSELKPDQLPSFLADVKAALAEKGITV
jgi:hypothetical protein